MSTLFESTDINGLVLKNRFARSATWEGMAEADGTCSQQLIDLMQSFAQGQVGLIITSHMYVTREGQATPLQMGIDSDTRVTPLRRMTAAVHGEGGKIIAQIAHAGCFTNAKLTGMPPMALSILDEKGQHKYRQATATDLQQLVQDYADAARRVREAGFDGVQLHGAHGYLLSQALSPALNQRNDAYGGSLENRARLPLEVLAAVRQTVGEDFPVVIKVNCADFLEGGLELQEALAYGRMLQDAGVDAIEVSGGTIVSGSLSPVREKISSEAKEAYFREGAKAYKAALQVPVFLVGGIRSITLAEELYDAGVADYFSMARPFIREPALIKRWMEGDRRKSTCISDNQCHIAARSGEGLYCVVEKKQSGQ